MNFIRRSIPFEHSTIGALRKGCEFMILKKIKRILAFTLLLAMLLSILPPVALAADEETRWNPIELTDITSNDTIAITMSKGDVTYADLQALLPFNNDIVLCSIKGRDLKEKFFETDNDRYFIAYGQYGEDVRRNIDPNETYYIIVDSYTSHYAPNRLTVVAEYTPGIYARDLLADYIAAGGLA